MKGIFAYSPKTLADALRPIDELCRRLDWAISLQSGPFAEHRFTDPKDTGNTLALFYDFSNDGETWFRRGLLPKYAADLHFDEGSFYLGFEANVVNPRALHAQLRGDICPRPRLFEVIATTPCVYLLYVDGWWEAYSVMDDVLLTLKQAWNGKSVYSNRWDGRLEIHPSADCPDPSP